MKFMYKKEFFQSLGTKNKLHAKCRDENNSLTEILYSKFEKNYKWTIRY
jgi:hypothetical protein